MSEQNTPEEKQEINLQELKHELVDLMTRLQLEVEAEKKKNAELQEVCTHLETLSKTALTELEENRETFKKTREELEALKQNKKDELEDLQKQHAANERKFHEKRTALEKENEQLKTEYDKQIHKIDEQAVKSAELKDKLKSLAEAKEKNEALLKAQIKQLEETPVALKKIQTNLETALQNEKEQFVKLQNKHIEAEASLHALNEARIQATKEMNDRFQQQEKEQDVLEIENQNIKNEIQKQIQELTKQKNTIMTLEAQIEDLTQIKNQNETLLKQKTGEFKTKQAALENENQNLKKDIHKQTQELNKQKDQKITLEAQLEGITEIKNQQEALLKKRTNEFDEKVKALSADMNQQLDYERAELQRKITYFQERVNSMEALEIKQQEIFANLKKSKQEWQEKHSALEAVKDTIFSNFKSERERLTQMTASYSALQGKFVEAAEESSEWKAEAEALKQRLKELETLQEKNREQENDVREKENALMQALDLESERNLKLEEEIKRLKALQALLEKISNDDRKSSPERIKKALSGGKEAEGLELILELEDERMNSKEWKRKAEDIR